MMACNPHPNSEMFEDAVEGVETLLEAIVGMFEEGHPDQIEEEDCDEEEWQN